MQPLTTQLRINQLKYNIMEDLKWYTGAFIAMMLFIGIGYACGVSAFDMPEEIDQLTTNAQHPDTLIGWQDNKGVIHIGFKH